MSIFPVKLSLVPADKTVAADGVVNLFDDAYQSDVNSIEDAFKLINVEGTNFSTKRDPLVQSFN